ncbi:indolepyruvate ferredoxin oxidoreductase family protein [Pseudomonas putida]|uniref:indolepyruvate ferredoxin oxidoreductase family protein n=1 Tax=Pseudomonas putida TaxID=303 RepID=UPI00236417AD|nr:indolepyruvate ferredoxin oxidoreductase family protein [Pseudomonas putida]MDD2068703.1 indolepyruvate ferredoxin oxidoreductase family protein [Pseudomonas putida]HDS1738636.1 indolepyruvate ferredoxin oxidoreductase family protein [Pseudomonas putida]
MTKTTVSLDDKYLQETGRVFMSSNQALVRLPIDQARRDKHQGLRTAGYISGYRGSPLGVYDAALWAAQGLLDEHNIKFQPGLNEELAATAIRGTQELDWFGKSNYQGVFGLWYGKGLGVDRACESLKLGNLEGAAAHGGFLAVAGDDHGGKSSASAHQSEHTLVAAFIPVLYPSTIAEILEYGVYGWALSRYSGLYVGLKCVTDTLDLSASVELPDLHRAFVTPEVSAAAAQGLNLIPKRTPLAQEDAVVNHRLPAAQAFLRANKLDRVVLDAPQRRLGIVTAGKAYLDVRQALADLGLDDQRCEQLGIRLYKPAMIWPLEPEGVLAFGEGSEVLLVVEEKRALMEDQIARYFYPVDAQKRPHIIGKQDRLGAPLLPQTGELTAALVRKAIITALQQLGMDDPSIVSRCASWAQTDARAGTLGSSQYRPAFYCSGCPHNTSTRIPEGSTALSAVGCHGLAAYVMPERNTMQPMPMGGDGMQWVSVGPMVDMPHVFQNMGDGTYSHSGILAIRAAVAANANMTYKLLYNDAVAMTGGQPVEAHLSPLDMLNQLVAEGVKPVLLVSDDVEKYRKAAIPADVSVHHRDELDDLQRQLREIKGVSAIVYEQTCATEKRRRRKRGNYPDPDKRVFINQEVCEGCGDCSTQSNCVSIQPLETELGRKRKIDQSTCNKDFSCVKGFCPSFVTVSGAKIATHAGFDNARLDALLEALPKPATVPLEAAGHNMLVAGIGGTGVLTVGALLGMAAHLEGKGCTILDLTGMAQKGGAVTSHIRTGPTPEGIFTSRLGVGMTDLILGCDLIVTAGADVLKTVRPGSTHVIANTDVTPTGAFQTNRDMVIDQSGMIKAVEMALGSASRLLQLPASNLATALTGDSIATNIFMLGYAAQQGLLPVRVRSLEKAIVLNGTFVKGNLRVFKLGRLAAHAPEALRAEQPTGQVDPAEQTLEHQVAQRIRLLSDYQSPRYAKRYADWVRSLEQQVATLRIPGAEKLVLQAARTLARLMAYKDEYEVARLHADPAFWTRLHEQFSGKFKVKFHLAPPMLPGRDASGRPRKREFGAWMLPVFRALQHGKRLRGTPFDPFGYTHERRQERQLIGDYQALVSRTLQQLTSQNLDVALALLSAADDIRGFGPVKEQALSNYRKRCDELSAKLEGQLSSDARIKVVEVHQ